MKQKDYHHHPRLHPHHGDPAGSALANGQRVRNASVPPPSATAVKTALRSVEMLGGSIDESNLLAHALGDRRLAYRQDLRQIALGMADVSIVHRLHEAVGSQ